MGEAVDESLSLLRPGDIAAIVTYLRTVPGIVTSDLATMRAGTAPTATDAVAANVDQAGKSVYAGACAGCHGWTGVSPVLSSATLTGTRSVNDSTAINVAQVIIGGSQRYGAGASTHMPAFGDAYSDAEIASVANYVTAQFGAKGSQLTAARIAKLRTQN